MGLGLRCVWGTGSGSWLDMFVGQHAALGSRFVGGTVGGTELYIFRVKAGGNGFEMC